MSRSKPKTRGMEWLAFSMASFNGSGYADKSTPETYVESYRAYKRMRHDHKAVALVDENLDLAVGLAAPLCFAKEPGHTPSPEAFAKFRQFYNPNNASFL